MSASRVGDVISWSRNCETDSGYKDATYTANAPYSDPAAHDNDADLLGAPIKPKECDWETNMAIDRPMFMFVHSTTKIT